MAAGEELAQRVAEHVRVDYVALADRVGGERQRDRALGQNRAVHAGLHGCDEPGLNVQSDDVASGSTTEA